ncbi:MAG TPA: hypothetical protein PKW33_09675 [Anaerolineaceae bacterium]|nr:hypothetical protein [Anaerolineaceae bacterium]HPN51844.1 hypothetical protein [Anaerolineaceae bacterium]
MTISPRSALCRCAAVVILAAALLLAFQPVQASVTLLSFTLTTQNLSVTARWQMASENGLTGFYLQRAAAAAGPFQRASTLIPATGDLLMGGTYQTTDSAGLAAGQVVYYRLEALQSDQTSQFFDPASVTIRANTAATAATPTPTATPQPYPAAGQPSPTPQSVSAVQNQPVSLQATAYPAPQPVPTETPAASAQASATAAPAYPAATPEPLVTSSPTVPPYPPGVVPTLIQGVTNNPTQTSNDIMLPGLSFGNMSPTAEPAKLPDLSDPKSAPWIIGAIVVLAIVWVILKWLQSRDETPKL